MNRITVLIILATTGFIAQHTLGLVKEDYRLYTLESACVTKHIINGVERKNIQTADGTCTITKENI